ncbi:MAG: hypothetical protein AAF250_09520 [Pseudomonadota bacterium]
MTSAPIRTTGRDRWSNPRPYTDASLRQMKHGPIRPMEEPSFIERWLGGF